MNKLSRVVDWFDNQSVVDELINCHTCTSMTLNLWIYFD